MADESGASRDARVLLFSPAQPLVVQLSSTFDAIGHAVHSGGGSGQRLSLYGTLLRWETFVKMLLSTTVADVKSITEPTLPSRGTCTGSACTLRGTVA